MRKFLNSAIIFLFVFVFFGCPSPSSGGNDDPPEEDKYPELTVLYNETALANNATLDFGSVVVDTSGHNMTIVIRNDGDADLTLEDADFSFTLAYDLPGWSYTPVTIAPGDTWDLLVTFDPYRVDEFNASLTLTTDDSDESEFVINFVGEVTAEPEPDLTVSSGGETIDLGAYAYRFRNVLINGTYTTDTITLANTGQADLVITEMNFSDADVYSYSGLTLPCTITPGEQETFQVSCQPTETGSASGELDIVSNDSRGFDYNLLFYCYAVDTATPVLAIEVDGTEYADNDTSFDFGAVMENEGEATKEITIKNTGTADLVISAMYLEDSVNYTMESLTLPLTITAGSSTTFDLDFHPKSSTGLYSYIRLTSNDPGIEYFRFNFTGSAAEDTIAPAEVTDLQADPGENSVYLTWTEPADADFRRTVITYTPGTASAVSTSSEYRTISGLEVLETYTFTVQTEDWDGNFSTGVQIAATTDWEYQNTYSGTGDAVYHVDAGSLLYSTTINYNLDLGSSTKDVYFIFTNTSIDDTVAAPSVADYSSSVALAPNMNRIGSSGGSWQPPAVAGQPVIRDNPDATEFNNNLPSLTRGPRRNAFSGAVPGPNKATVADTHNFIYDDPASGLIPATCRSVTTDGTTTLNIWVADDCWDGAGVKANDVDQTMVDALAAKFLATGTNNDIYDWVTNIFGAEWGSHGYSDLITDDGEITILIYDIDGDNSTTGGTVGFFWAKDNFKSSALNTSNERIMFYLDAVMLAEDEGGSWDITDYWPSTLVSTLAHEFQHMINFYQKAILRSGGTACEPWINEMMAMCAEDLVSTKIGDMGPRGVAHTDGTAGSSMNSDGRLPIYNYANIAPLADWLEGNELISYSVNYAFGAYLLRNYGGAALAQDIVQNSYTDYRAINSALAANGYSVNFTDVLQYWGAANLLSDNTSAADPYRYNSGTWFDSVLNSITYSLGSINLYNYVFGPDQGPAIVDDLSVLSGQAYTSNIYYRVGSDLTGDITKTITLQQGVKLTVVVKED